jgi:hypothetical protein
MSGRFVKSYLSSISSISLMSDPRDLGQLVGTLSACCVGAPAVPHESCCLMLQDVF